MDERKVAASAELIQERLQNGHTAQHGQRAASTEKLEIERFEPSVIADLQSYAGVDDLEGYMCFDEWPADEELPGWVPIVSDLLDFLFGTESPNTTTERFERDVPFVEIFARIAEYSRHQFIDDLDAGHLAEQAVHDFEAHLIDRLVDVSAQAIHLDFVRYVAERDPGVIEDDRLHPDSTSWYDGYISAFFDGRAADVFERFPVMARLLIVVAEQWGATLSTFVSRLEGDYRQICSLLDSDEPGQVVRVDAGAGDPHDRGQTVLIVAFENGDELVYKPRDIAPEREFYTFEDWLNDRFDDIPELQTPKVIARAEYGWVEKVTNEPFSSVAAIEEYYRATGAILCILYVLNASDCHFENVIASETSPVIVDAETILQTDISITETSRAKSNAKLRQHVARSSVLKTMLLPFEMEANSNVQSGLAMIDEQRANVRQVSWMHVNTDAMDIEYRTPTIVPEGNVPMYDGDPAPPDQFVDEIVDGFGTTYDAIVHSRATVKRQVTDQFGEIRVRNILQETALYQALLDTLTNPSYLRSGVEHGCKIQKTLSKRLASSSFIAETDWVDDVLEAEQRAIARRDVPRFTMLTDDGGVSLGETAVSSDVFEQTGIERVRNRIESLSEADKIYQQGLIRACLDSGEPMSASHRGAN